MQSQPGLRVGPAVAGSGDGGPAHVAAPDWRRVSSDPFQGRGPPLMAGKSATSAGRGRAGASRISWAGPWPGPESPGPGRRANAATAGGPCVIVALAQQGRYAISKRRLPPKGVR